MWSDVGTHRDPVPVHEIAVSWSDRLQSMLNALVRDRDLIPPERSIDVRFDEFLADELETVARIYDLAGEPLTDAARTAMAAYLGTAPTKPAGQDRDVGRNVGLDEHGLPSRLARYRERFSV